MIRQGENKYKEDLAKMWKRCFPSEADSFIDFYFKQVYKDEETLVFIEDNKPIASLQMIPYSMKIGTAISTAGYISGAMTHPDFQKRGYMGKLLNAAFKTMQTKGYDYTFLIPQKEWLFGYYGKFGYAPAFPERKENLLTSNIGNFTGQAPTDVIKRFSHPSFGTDSPVFSHIYASYSCFLSEMPHVVLKSESQFAHILWDFFDEKGVLFANNQGIAFTFQKEDTVIIKDFFYRDKKIKQAFLASINQYYAPKKIIIRYDPNAPVTRYKGMIKPLNASKEVITDIYMDTMLD
jgi:predicted acetyltransferase